MAHSRSQCSVKFLLESRSHPCHGICGPERAEVSPCCFGAELLYLTLYPIKENLCDGFPLSEPRHRPRFRIDLLHRLSDFIPAIIAVKKCVKETASRNTKRAIKSLTM